MSSGNFSCHYCKGTFDLATESTWDHIVPKHLGGANHTRNMVRCCQPCNQEKGAQFPTCSCGRCRSAVTMWASRQKKVSADELAKVIAGALDYVDPNDPSGLPAEYRRAALATLNLLHATVRLDAYVDGSTAYDLAAIAKRDGISITEALRRSVQSYSTGVDTKASA